MNVIAQNYHRIVKWSKSPRGGAFFEALRLYLKNRETGGALTKVADFLDVAPGPYQQKEISAGDFGIVVKGYSARDAGEEQSDGV